MFGSYNYLGLANNDEVKAQAIEAIKKYGVASGGVRLISGTMVIHIKMEEMLAKFTGKDDALTTGTGFGTNSGLVPAIINLLGMKVRMPLFSRDDVIISDELNHASIIDGCRLAKAKIVVYKHLDIDDLHDKLKKCRKNRKLIITDGVFSMDGDIAPLDKIIELAKEYNALTMVDDAHSIGVLGKDSGGTADHFGVQKEIDVNMGTMSKGLGCSGGFVSGSKELIDYLRVACRSYVFSDSVPPVIATSVIAVLNHIKKHPELKDSVHSNATYFRDKMNDAGFDTMTSATQIVPWLIGPERKAVKVYDLLFQKGIFAPAVRWPAVPKGKARIRFNLMATHTREQIDKLISVCKEINKEVKVIA